MKLTLRFPDPELHRILRESAKANHRSLNAEILHRLRVSVQGYRR